MRQGWARADRVEPDLVFVWGARRLFGRPRRRLDAVRKPLDVCLRPKTRHFVLGQFGVFPSFLSSSDFAAALHELRSLGSHPLFGGVHRGLEHCWAGRGRIAGESSSDLLSRRAVSGRLANHQLCVLVSSKCDSNLAGKALVFVVLVFFKQGQVQETEEFKSSSHRGMDLAIWIACSVCLVVYLLCGIFGYLSFFENTSDNILVHFPVNLWYFDLGKSKKKKRSIYFLLSPKTNKSDTA